jgi:hypothetical protein
VLGSPVDLGIVDPDRGQLALEAGDGIGDELLALAALLVELLGDLLVGIGMQEAEREVFQFPLQFPDAEAVGERRIEFQRFARDRHAQFVRLHRVMAQRLRARGEAQENDADILDHRQQHLAQDFDLRFHFRRLLLAALGRMCNESLGDRAQAIEAENTVNEFCRALAETLLDLDHTFVVEARHREEQRRQPAIGIELQADEDQRHAQGVVPNAFAAAERAVAVDGLRKLHRRANRLRLVGGKPFAQGLEGMFEVALRGDGMDDGNHARIINRHTPANLSSFVTVGKRRRWTQKRPRCRILL